MLAGETGESRPGRLPRAAEDRFRTALTASADDIPGHAIEKLGEASAVRAVEVVPVYRVRLDSLYEWPQY